MSTDAEARPAAASRRAETWDDSSRRFAGLVALAGVGQAFLVVAVLQGRNDELGAAHEVVSLDPTAHWLRDSVMYAPVGVALLLASSLVARRLVAGWSGSRDGVGASVVWAGLAALVYAVASVPAAGVHAELFLTDHAPASEAVHLAQEAVVTLRYSFAFLLVFAMVLGLPWGSPRRRSPTGPPPSPLSTRRRNPC